MKDEPSNSRSLAQHRVQARKFKRRAIFEVLAFIVLSFGMYVLIHEGLHIVLKSGCGFMILQSALSAIGDYDNYKRRLATIKTLESSPASPS